MIRVSVRETCPVRRHDNGPASSCVHNIRRPWGRSGAGWLPCALTSSSDGGGGVAAVVTGRRPISPKSAAHGGARRLTAAPRRFRHRRRGRIRQTGSTLTAAAAVASTPLSCSAAARRQGREHQRVSNSHCIRHAMRDLCRGGAGRRGVGSNRTGKMASAGTGPVGRGGPVGRAVGLAGAVGSLRRSARSDTDTGGERKCFHIAPIRDVTCDVT